MFDCVISMQTQFRKIKAVVPVGFFQKASSEVGHEEAKRWGKVERVSDSGVELLECDVLPVVR